MREDKTPMGVSQWKEHGIRYGYWLFWKDKILKDDSNTSKKEIVIITFAVSSVLWCMLAIGFDAGRDYERINTPKNEIVDYFCDDLDSWICMSDGCNKEFEKMESMCNLITNR